MVKFVCENIAIALIMPPMFGVIDATAAPVTAPANSAAATRSTKVKASGSNVKAASSNVKVAAVNGSGARGSSSKSTVKKEEGGKSGQLKE